MIKINSKRAGFRRCGIAHPKDSVMYPDGRFTAAELAILKAEPMLVVVEIVKPAPPKASIPEPDPKPAAETAAEASAKPAETGKEPVKAGKKGKR